MSTKQTSKKVSKTVNPIVVDQTVDAATARPEVALAADPVGPAEAFEPTPVVPVEKATKSKLSPEERSANKMNVFKSGMALYDKLGLPRTKVAYAHQTDGSHKLALSVDEIQAILAKLG